MVDDTPVTLDQIRDLIQPVTNRLDDLSGQVASIKKKKPNHLVDSADLKWRKEDKKMQYKAWSEAWDHCDKARDAANLGNQVATKAALKEGINFLETKMRDVLSANQQYKYIICSIFCCFNVAPVVFVKEVGRKYY